MGRNPFYEIADCGLQIADLLQIEGLEIYWGIGELQIDCRLIDCAG
jgi:hypothetical protein